MTLSNEQIAEKLTQVRDEIWRYIPRMGEFEPVVIKELNTIITALRSNERTEKVDWESVGFKDKYGLVVFFQGT